MEAFNIEPFILDGESWNLKIKMTNGRVKESFGINMYPGTFDELERMMKRSGRG